MVILFVAIVPVTAFGTPTAQQSGNFNVSVAGTAVGSIPHQTDLKATQLPGGQLSEVTSFVVGPEDVVQVKQGENLIVSTSPDLRTHQVTVRNIQGILIDLVPLPSNAWSLQSLLPGVYTLDVNVAMSSSGIFGTYETILVILGPDQQPLPPTTVIRQITVEESAVCPPNLILVNRNCVESTPTPTPIPKPWDDCNDPSQNVPETMCPPDLIPTPQPDPCTPDGPECPPCPDGVEAGRCADEDERQDTNDNLGNDESDSDDEGEGNIDPPSMFEGDDNGNGEGSGGDDSGGEDDSGGDDIPQFG